MSEIILVPLQFDRLALLKSIQADITQITQLPTSIENHNLKIDLFFDSQRGQYDALKMIQAFEEENTFPSILLTNVDLFIPIFTFVFGLAKLNGNIGIVSTCRLENNFYGLPDNYNLLKQRILKEIIHEYGHLAGLRHCSQFNCVMASSTSADEIDIKLQYFCDACQIKSKINISARRI
jgi:archaemetzincin